MQHMKNIEGSICVRKDAEHSTAGEFGSMAALDVRAWAVAAHGIELSDECHRTLEEKFLRDIRGNVDGVLVAAIDGTICGWGACVPDTNYISDLWIDPPCHRLGIGRRILDALMTQILLGGFDEACIGTHADNHPAISLYEKTGFSIDWRGEEWSESFGRTVEKVRMSARL